ncbi:MAG: hypothetical protein IKO74_05695 [Selenomonadaceae bacterium]|nr:hypothetical protein [Selenomonadaceae bacterium]
MFKRTLAAMLILAVTICFGVKVDAADARHTKDDQWLIYMYICGTDLEESGAATNDIFEMQDVDLPPNVKVLIYANGAINWKHGLIERKGPGVYLYHSGGLSKLSSWKADMGKPETLKKFLKFGEENFNIDRRILILWDHGGVNGICYDFAFDNTSKPERFHHLTYDDLNKVFASVYGHSNKKPFELIGFDACMTGSYELANSIADYSRYMVGSEPSTPGAGWYYTYWIGELAKNPAMNGAAIGRAVCDGNMAYYTITDKETGGYGSKISAYSLIDLSKMPDLRKAYEKYFSEAKNLSINERGFSGKFARAASGGNAERYSDRYTDLSILAENTSAILPEASAELISALNEAVVHNQGGSYLRGKGISTYYPYVLDEFGTFLTQKSTPSAQKNLYKNLLKLDVSNLSGLPINENSDGNGFIQLTPEQLENVSNVECVIMPWVEGGDESFGLENTGFVILPSDTHLKRDWDSGTFTENFSWGGQPTIDGHKITMKLITEKILPPENDGTDEEAFRDYYEVPIYWSGKRQYTDENGEAAVKTLRGPCNLLVAYEWATKNWRIFGIGSDVENGMVRQMNIFLKPGDIIVPRFDALISTGNNLSYKSTYGEPFVYREFSKLDFPHFEKGTYAYMFSFTAPNGNAVNSSYILINVDENGNITRDFSKE